MFKNGQERFTYDSVLEKIDRQLPVPQLLHRGSSISIQEAIKRIDPDYHGALEEVEGAVWRVERKGKVDFLAKYVRECKVDGKYFPEITGKDSVWHWHYDQNKIYKFNSSG